VVGPELVGCIFVKRQADGILLCGVIVETGAYTQDDPACQGYCRRSPQNETLFGEPRSFSIHLAILVDVTDPAQLFIPFLPLRKER